jgi:hypothetical protein
MAQAARALNYKRAITTFAASYIAVEIVAALFSILTAAVMHANFSGNKADVHNPAFVTSERFYPLINLVIWVFFAWAYFRKQPGSRDLLKDALRLVLQQRAVMVSSVAA